MESLTATTRGVSPTQLYSPRRLTKQHPGQLTLSRSQPLPQTRSEQQSTHRRLLKLVNWVPTLGDKPPTQRCPNFNPSEVRVVSLLTIFLSCRSCSSIHISGIGLHGTSLSHLLSYLTLSD